ncbi:MAG: hypothetical protein NT105_17590 [Verrucomicrobia bacterium]|nr:hypothetical protein [Verrucomicrobiota bacterium]
MKRGAKVLGVLFGIYVFSYIALSCFGAYAPAVWGTAGVKWYRWAPAGFYNSTTGKWRRPFIVYLPLWGADNNYWHSHWPFPADNDPTYPAVFPGFEHK